MEAENLEQKKVLKRGKNSPEVGQRLRFSSLTSLLLRTHFHPFIPALSRSFLSSLCLHFFPPGHRSGARLRPRPREELRAADWRAEKGRWVGWRAEGGVPTHAHLYI